MKKLILSLVFLICSLLITKSFATQSLTPDQELFLVGKKLSLTHPDSALVISTLLKEKALKTGDETTLANAQYIEGKSFMSKDKVEKSLTSLYKAASGYQKENELDGLANALKFIGVCHNYLNSYRYAIDNHFEELGYRKHLTNENYVAECYYNIGYNFSYLDQFDSAINYMEKALAIAERVEDTRRVEDCLYELGTYFYEKNMFDEAEKRFTKAERIAVSINDHVLLAFINKSKGNLYLKKGMLAEAEEQLLKAIGSQQIMSNERNAIYVYRSMVELYETKHEYKEVEKYYLLIAQLDKTKTDALLQRELLGSLYELYVSTNRVEGFKNIGIQLVRLNTYTSELEENNKRLHNMYKAERIKILFENSELKNEVKEKKQDLNILYIAISVVVLSLLIVIRFWYNVNKEKKSHEGLLSFLRERNRLFADIRHYNKLNIEHMARIIELEQGVEPYEKRVLY